MVVGVVMVWELVLVVGVVVAGGAGPIVDGRVEVA